MKTKMLASFLVIALVAAVIGGASMAYFTAKTDAPAAEFTAGTVLVEAGLKAEFEMPIVNVNPGDCYCVGWWIQNTGSKAIELRVVGNGTWAYNWTWLEENWEALCFSDVIGVDKEYDDFAAFKAAMEGTEPGMGDPANPVFVIPCPHSGYNWTLSLIMDNGDVVGYELYYLGGPVPAGEMVQLCLCVAFDGPLMGNIFQAATFTLSGRVEAVQASNNAPYEVWGVDLDNMPVFFHPYFDGFDFSKCIDPHGCCTPPTVG